MTRWTTFCLGFSLGTLYMMVITMFARLGTPRGFFHADVWGLDWGHLQFRARWSARHRYTWVPTDGYNWWWAWGPFELSGHAAARGGMDAKWEAYTAARRRLVERQFVLPDHDDHNDNLDAFTYALLSKWPKRPSS